MACSSCHAQIVWVITTNGKLMPLDPLPDPRGIIRYTGRQVPAASGRPTDEVEYIDQSTEMKLDELRYTSHFATCEFADQHRKKR